MNRRCIRAVLLSLAVFPVMASGKIVHLMPTPKVVTEGTGVFSLQRPVRLDDPTHTVALERLFRECGLTTAVSAPLVRVSLTDNIEGAYDYHLDGYDNEAYQISITPQTIDIRAVTQTGVIRAAQTLMQLAEGYDGEKALQVCDIRDWPAFKLRGFMHDVGRSFISVEELKHEIDLLSRFKVNTFHFHLTENQAWRFEVKAYPVLTAAAGMTRFPGCFYSQAECREIEDYAAERGMTVIPEIDMPGHSEAFERAMGHGMQTTQGVGELKEILSEVVAVFRRAPYIHIGADEQAITYPDFLGIMTRELHRLGKKVVIWNPVVGQSVTRETGADMVQLWSTAGKKVEGLPNIDCRYNYVNHFDTFADLAGIYQSQIYYATQGDAGIAGEIAAFWNDRKMNTEQDIIRQNNFYANILASAERAWKGGGSHYIEEGGTALPENSPQLEEFADWEARFLFHKSHCLSNEPIPYVRQSNIHWLLSDGETTCRATGAGIYLRHTWGNTVPALSGLTFRRDTVHACTFVWSPIRQKAGALIEFHHYGRSEKDQAPDIGCWDRKGSRVWLDDEEIMPPLWTNAGRPVDMETPLCNENLTARPPIAVELKQGWNKVHILLPDTKPDGIRLNKWMFTFVLTDPEGRNALDGLVYSPQQSLSTEHGSKNN